MPDKPESKDKKGEADLQKSLEALQGMIKDLPKGMQEGFRGALTDFQRTQLELMEKQNSKPAADDDEDEKVDLDKLDRSEFAQWMLKGVMKEVNKALQPIGDAIKETRENQSKADVRREFEQVRAKNPDFDKWKPEMAKLYEANPSLGAQDLYDLAKTRNPDKVKELADEAAKDGKDGNEDKKDKKASPFGGFFPTNTPSGEEGKAATDMEPKDAAEAAWESAMSEVPDAVMQQFLGN